MKVLILLATITAIRHFFFHMKSSLLSYGNEIDRVLRGEYTTRESLCVGKIEMPVGRLVQASILLGMLYGVCMGLFPMMRDSADGLQQMASTIFKVPLLFLLTLVVTFPSLYVFSALAGSRLGAKATMRLLIIAITINLAVLAGFGPVTAFFILCTEHYPFIKLLNVLMFGIGGVISLVFLRRALDHVFDKTVRPAPPPLRPEKPETVGESVGQEGEEGLADVSLPLGRAEARGDVRARQIFVVWLVVYGTVGAQMGWVLRPFIGSPNLPFELFRDRDSNFFANLVRTIGDLFS